MVICHVVHQALLKLQLGPGQCFQSPETRKTMFEVALHACLCSQNVWLALGLLLNRPLCESYERRCYLIGSLPDRLFRIILFDPSLILKHVKSFVKQYDQRLSGLNLTSNPLRALLHVILATPL